jgi:hypothetical protein
LLLQRPEVLVIVPAPLTPTSDFELEALPYLAWWVRGGLIAIAVGLLVVFGIAIALNPYDEQGQPRRMETHRQMGLPP